MMTEVVKENLENLSLQNKPIDKKPKKIIGSKGSESSSAFPIEINPQPSFILHRIKLFEHLKAKEDEALAARQKIPIVVRLADGRVYSGDDVLSWKTTPVEVCKAVNPGLLDSLIVAKVNGILWDISRPLEGSCAVAFLTFDDDEGRDVFWHSSAHILGEACERHYGCSLCHGPPVEDGFFYDMDTSSSGRTVSNADYPALESLSKGISKEKQRFERLVVSKNDLLEMFRDNPFKVEFIREKIPDGDSSTVYRCGTLVDLCQGPHVQHTGRVKAFKVLKNSSSYFKGDAANASLQRIYGVSFPDASMMTEHLKFLEEADRRDHRRVGRDQNLFFFHELSPGSAFFTPHGTRIYNRLVDYIRSEYIKRGFSEVITPNIYNAQLWKQSGHWQNYQENMFSFALDKETFALKPMNCPGHCLMFSNRERSYRELPIRLADFGVLHRNELTGALGGLTRVRRFQQDDAHIFCRQDQVANEIHSCLSFLESVYETFGFSFTLCLSTRPEKYLGELSVWDAAEAQLKTVLDASGHPWSLNPGDGAFYGPKIDITIQDAHRRRIQCATIQLDFQLPIRFDLEYRAPGVSDLSSHGSNVSCEIKSSSQIECEHGKGHVHEVEKKSENDGNQVQGQAETFKEGEKKEMASIMQRPVIIHRAILGSIERMFAILAEHFAGDWPFWLSPRQVSVIPVSHNYDAYALRVAQSLQNAGMYADADVSDLTLNKRIRNAETGHYTFILVVGAKEEESGTVNIRKASIDGTDIVLSLDDAIARLQALSSAKSRAKCL